KPPGTGVTGLTRFGSRATDVNVTLRLLTAAALPLALFAGTPGADATANRLPSLPAFPGAEGGGAFTPGGRGGRVIAVTNLNDSGPGSFRAACEAEGPRTVVFRVSGTIALESKFKIVHPYLTIAGQTAPGDGICIKNYQVNFDTKHLIIRYLR